MNLQFIYRLASKQIYLNNVCSCPETFTGSRCQTLKLDSSRSSSEDGGGITWVLVLVFIVVAVAVAGISGCAAYFIMRRKQYDFFKFIIKPIVSLHLSVSGKIFLGESHSCMSGCMIMRYKSQIQCFSEKMAMKFTVQSQALLSIQTRYIQHSPFYSQYQNLIPSGLDSIPNVQKSVEATFPTCVGS